METTNRVKQIHTNFRQSIWLDFIDREIMRSGKLQQLIAEDGIRGVTSNPAIFAQAIAASADYDADIASLSDNYPDDEDLFYQLAIKDIRQAADLFAPVYNEEISGADGYVSLEVSPFLALDGESTSRQAMKLWLAVDRKNVMIKIPATQPCLPSITEAISQGININVTLIFGLERYREVALAYIEGLEQRLQAGLDVSRVASVASFFLSRIDIQLDPVLDSKDLGEMKGEAAIALAKTAYQVYQELFNSARWQKLAAAGAKPQRLLWASTGNKNPAYRDTRYIDELIGPDTVNTAPLNTIAAFRDHGKPAASLQGEPDWAKGILAALSEAGIDLTAVAAELETAGIAKFNEPYQQMLAAIAAKRIVIH
ncbi:transaldolase [Mucilaginibacter conchicola]|uniref:Transaldolase n=1 Tax=Mucilaginibacter conchicola TaxID=2303333 RepID=A0A372NXI8_9SPHI|nr:transaldolase [Mucilaginibacter conchicola]RFZ94833.1 transaldolase [Mucilaginibacter conchicola]